MAKELGKEKQRLGNLKQNKGKTPEEIEALAKIQIEKNSILSGLIFCLAEEKSFAEALLSNYLNEHSFVNSSEKDSLIHLIDLEVLLSRIKQQLNLEWQKANKTIPVQYIQQVSELTEQIIKLKETLGLVQKESQKDTVTEWNKLKEKALNYYKESAGCNVVRCPDCKKLFMILKDMKSCIEMKLPWFKKTLLYNRKLFELYDQNRLTKDEMAVIFGVSQDYIDYIYEGTYKNESSKI